jgi:hypothetical protein
VGGDIVVQNGYWCCLSAVGVTPDDAGGANCCGGEFAATWGIMPMNKLSLTSCMMSAMVDDWGSILLELRKARPADATAFFASASSFLIVAARSMTTMVVFVVASSCVPAFSMAVMRLSMDVRNYWIIELLADLVEEAIDQLA